MNEVVSEVTGSALARFVERNPHVGIFASIGGFGTSLISAIHAASVVIGFAGAVFGCIAGYYTMRCHYRKWKRAQAEDAAEQKK